MEICDDLREWDYGDNEGLTTPEIHVRNPTWNLWSDGFRAGRNPRRWEPARTGARAPAFGGERHDRS
jgi:probable phosphoglycerate mutase